MSIKAKAKLSTILTYPHIDEQRVAIRAAWLFGFGVMQPKSVNTHQGLGCDCPTPEHLLPHCPWHGEQARRMLS